jgi:RimJ/RimL family protein N-acetyltransferase
MTSLPRETFTDVFLTERLFIRALEDNETDRQHFHDIMAEPGMEAISSRMLLAPPNHRKDAAQLKRIQEGCMLSSLVCLREQAEGEKFPRAGQVIGFMAAPKVGGSDLRLGNMDSELGICLREEFQGKGYGPEAIRWCVSWVFKHTMAHRVTLRSYSFNEPAVRAWEKLGLVYEGRTREEMWFDGRWWDSVRYSALRQEWDTTTGRMKPGMEE